MTTAEMYKAGMLTMPTATERKLAPGWVREPSICLDDGCPDDQLTGVYVRYSDGDGACELHAENRRVLADSPPHPVPDAAMRDLLWGKRAPGDGGGGIVWTGGIDYGTDHGGVLRYAVVMPSLPAATKPIAPPRCGTCTHVHAGPCNGSSPNGEFACPCGHPKTVAKRERVNVVGTYNVYEPRETFYGKLTKTGDALHGATATLIANLSREKPPGRRPIRAVTRYEGNSDD